MNHPFTRPTETSGDPIIPEVDDDGTAPPEINAPGAGLKDLVVRLDGQSVNTASIACISDPACESAQRWTWDLTGVSNGIHTVTITSADKVGNQNVDSFQVDVERKPDEPARTNDTIKRNIIGASANDRAGTSVASLGDLNADGRTDYLIGAPGVANANGNAAGAAYLVMGASDTSTIDLANPGTSVIRVLGPGANQYCGTSVAAAGDLNDDGIDDFLVGCPGLDSRVGAVSATGRVYAIFGSSDPRDIDLANLGESGFAITGPTDNVNIGVPLLTSRATVFGERLQSSTPGEATTDVNNDGYDDIVIGDSAVYQGTKNAAGAAYVIFGKPDGATVDATALGDRGYVIRGAAASSLTGYSAAISDDVNGDTTADVLVGAPGAATTGNVGVGHAYVIKGGTSSDVDLASPDNRVVTLSSGQTGDRFGVNVAALGDTDLDTTPDIAVGTNSGAYVVRSLPTSSKTITVDDGYRVTGPTNQPALTSTAVPEAPIAPTGDIDGDDRADLIIGYPDAAGARALTIRSPSTSRTLNVATLPGQRGGAIGAGSQSERAGAAVGASSYLGREPNVTETGQSIIGAPSTTSDATRLNGGRAYVIAEPTPSGPGVAVDLDPADAGPTGTTTATTTARAAAAGEPGNGLIPGVYQVQASNVTEWVTARNDAQSLVIGSAHDGAQLYADGNIAFGRDSVDGKRRRYLHGLFGGALRRCAWIIQKQTSFVFAPSAPLDGRTCAGRPFRLPPYRFARLINTEAKGDGTLVRFRNVHAKSKDEGVLQANLPDRIPVYRNVRPGTNERALSPDGTLASVENGVRRQVRWRYITKSGRFALIRAINEPDLGSNKWVYVNRRWLPPMTGRSGSLCDDGLNVFAEPTVKPEHDDWPGVCSPRKDGYAVPDTP